MAVIRAFIAIEISPEIQSKLDQISAQLKTRLPGSPVRWVPVKNIHLTLKFLGNVSDASLAVLQEVLAAEASRHAPFEISVGELGAFPSTRRPRVVWVKVQAPADLDDLQRGIENEMARLGYTRERRGFTPHLTLGRVSRNANAREIRIIGEAIETSQVGYLGTMRSKEVHLFQSELKPGGAEYSRIFTALLQA